MVIIGIITLWITIIRRSSLSKILNSPHLVVILIIRFCFYQIIYLLLLLFGNRFTSPCRFASITRFHGFFCILGLLWSCRLFASFFVFGSFISFTRSSFLLGTFTSFGRILFTLFRHFFIIFNRLYFSFPFWSFGRPALLFGRIFFMLRRWLVWRWWFFRFLLNSFFFLLSFIRLLNIPFCCSRFTGPSSASAFFWLLSLLLRMILINLRFKNIRLRQFLHYLKHLLCFWYSFLVRVLIILNIILILILLSIISLISLHLLLLYVLLILMLVIWNLIFIIVVGMINHWSRFNFILFVIVIVNLIILVTLLSLNWR